MKPSLEKSLFALVNRAAYMGCKQAIAEALPKLEDSLTGLQPTEAPTTMLNMPPELIDLVKTLVSR